MLFLEFRVEQSSIAPVQAPISTATATARTLYNSTQYNNNNYDPYYALYDDDVELYRDAGRLKSFKSRVEFRLKFCRLSAATILQ